MCARVSLTIIIWISPKFSLSVNQNTSHCTKFHKIAPFRFLTWCFENNTRYAGRDQIHPNGVVTIPYTANQRLYGYIKANCKRPPKKKDAQALYSYHDPPSSNPPYNSLLFLTPVSTGLILNIFTPCASTSATTVPLG